MLQTLRVRVRVGFFEQLRNQATQFGDRFGAFAAERGKERAQVTFEGWSQQRLVAQELGLVARVELGEGLALIVEQGERGAAVRQR